MWAYKHIKPGRGPFGFVTLLIFSKRSTLGLAKLLLSNKNYSIIKQVIALYSYFRYVKFVSKVARKFIPKIYINLKNRAIIIRQKLNRKNIRRFINPRKTNVPSKFLLPPRKSFTIFNTCSFDDSLGSVK